MTENSGICVRNGYVIDNPKRRTLKIWSNKTQTFYYQSRDADFYRNYYHNTKQRITCEHCNRDIYKAQLSRHQQTAICQNAKLKKEIEELKQS